MTPVRCKCARIHRREGLSCICPCRVMREWWSFDRRGVVAANVTPRGGAADPRCRMLPLTPLGLPASSVGDALTVPPVRGLERHRFRSARRSARTAPPRRAVVPACHALHRLRAAQRGAPPCWRRWPRAMAACARFTAWRCVRRAPLPAPAPRNAAWVGLTCSACEYHFVRLR